MYQERRQRSDVAIDEDEKPMKQSPTMPRDPVRVDDLDRVVAQPLFEELFQEIVSSPAPALSVDVVAWRRRSRRPLVIVAAAVVVLLAVVLPLSLTAGGGLSHPVTTPFQAGHAFLPASKGSAPRVASGRWQLVSEESVLTGTWQQNTAGPPAGPLTCASVNACYVMASRYASPKAGAPLLSVSLYVTHDLGTSWSVLPMPDGFSPTTTLACEAETTCAAGGTYHGQSIFIVTTDGGSQWTMDPLLGVSGVLLQLSCSSAADCAGVVGPAWADHSAVIGPTDTSPDESFVTTGDGGATWTASAMAPADFVLDLACPAVGDCVVIGEQWDPTAPSYDATDFVRVTSNGGQTWNDGAFPKGFAVGYLSGLSCSDAQHCFVSGLIPITIANPPQCTSAQLPPSPPGNSTLPAMSPDVETISKMESALASQASAQEAAEGGGFSCSSATVQPVSDLASSADGGLSWTVDNLPADVPDPQLDSIACATSTECWASGSELVLEHVGQGTNADSPVLLGTTDGGTTWSKVVFSVPVGAPDAYGQSYLAIGSISCPSASACIAIGATAQSAPTAPVYNFVS